jgi:hypothetical protein
VLAEMIVKAIDGAADRHKNQEAALRDVLEDLKEVI